MHQDILMGSLACVSVSFDTETLWFWVPADSCLSDLHKLLALDLAYGTLEQVTLRGFGYCWAWYG